METREQKIDLYRDEIANIKVYLKNLEKNKEFWKNRIKELEQEIKELEDANKRKKLKQLNILKK